MSFIRVTERAAGKTKVDLNTVHVVSYRPDAATGSDIDLTDGTCLSVNESPRQLRSFIKKAQGTLPAPSEAVPAE